MRQRPSGGKLEPMPVKGPVRALEEYATPQPDLPKKSLSKELRALEEYATPQPEPPKKGKSKEQNHPMTFEDTIPAKKLR